MVQSNAANLRNPSRVPGRRHATLRRNLSQMLCCKVRVRIALEPASGRRNRNPGGLRGIAVLLSVGLLAACDGSRPSTSSGAASRPDASKTIRTDSSEELILNFVNFIEETAPETLPAFTRETGIKVNYDTY